LARSVLGSRQAARFDKSKKALLFEKRSKSFYLLKGALDPSSHQTSKSFLVLFFKKELLILLGIAGPTEIP
jgi:hypothetical protein